MRKLIKYLFVLFLGGALGSVFGVLWTFATMIQNEEIAAATKSVLSDKISMWLFGKPGETTPRPRRYGA